MIDCYVILLQTLPIKPFEIKDIDGLKGWIVTLVFLIVTLLIKELMNFFSGKKKDKEMTLILQIMVEQKNFNLQIQDYFQTIARQYSKNSSDEQINSVSKITFDAMLRHLQLFQRNIVENNHIDENKDYVIGKLTEEIQNAINRASTFLDNFYTTKFTVASKFIKQEWVERIYEVMYKNVFLIKDNKTMDESLERIFSCIRFEYYEKLKEASNGLHD